MFGSPAHADLDDVRVEAGAVTLNVGGGAATLSVRVTNSGNTAEGPIRVTVTVPLAEQQVKVGQASGCEQPNGNIIECNITPTIAGGQTRSFSIPLTPPATSSVQPGAEATGNGQVELNNGNDASFRLTLKGPAPQQTVTEVSGSVVDQTTASPLSNALVLLKDSAGTESTTTTDARGVFRFTGSAAKPIRPGTLTLGANREGYENGTLSRDGQAGRSLTNLKLSLKPTASAPPSAPAAVDPSGASADPSTTDLATPSNTSGESGTNLLSMLLIGTGVLLVLLGVGAIVLLMMRRKDDRDEPADDYGDPRQTQMVGAGAPASRGMYHGGGAAGATMVAHGGPHGAGMNDATEIVPSARAQQLDEFPDPYAAPASAGYGYGNGGMGGGMPTSQISGVPAAPASPPGYPGGGYARGPEPGYGGANGDYRGYGEQPHGGGRYADEPPRAGRYGADEPTGRFAGGGYPSAGGPGAGPGPAPGYRDEGGYAGGADYGRRGGHHGEPPVTEYEPRRSAYPPPSDYERPRAGGYGGPPDPRNGYGDSGRHDSGRHDSGGRHGGPPGPGGPGYSNGRGRQVDWLDD
jgi:hypothetical protein